MSSDHNQNSQPSQSEQILDLKNVPGEADRFTSLLLHLLHKDIQL